MSLFIQNWAHWSNVKQQMNRAGKTIRKHFIKKEKNTNILKVMFDFNHLIQRLLYSCHLDLYVISHIFLLARWSDLRKQFICREMSGFGFRKSTWQSCWAVVTEVICGHCVFFSTDFFCLFFMIVYLLPFRFDNILFSCFFRLWACAVWVNKGHLAMHRFTDYHSWCSNAVVVVIRNQGKEPQFKKTLDQEVFMRPWVSRRCLTRALVAGHQVPPLFQVDVKDVSLEDLRSLDVSSRRHSLKLKTIWFIPHAWLMGQGSQQLSEYSQSYPEGRSHFHCRPHSVRWTSATAQRDSTLVCWQ